MGEENIEWRFYGYVTPAPAKAKDVQVWFDSLTEEEKDDARDVLGYLRVQPRHLWREPGFKSFDPEISEIRFKANTTKKAYRVYGAFWPAGKRLSYTFLIGKNKKVNNDQDREKEAQKRLKRLQRGEASVHEFKFENESHSQNTEGETGSASVC
jgi:hypothetical protein